jgi:shikimate kinase
VPPPSPANGPLAVLCGPMGAGKSTVAKVLAERWGVSVRDTDHDIAVQVGTSVAQFLTSRGESAFRDVEHEVVLAALTEHDGVLALGGGAVLHEGTRTALGDYASGGGVVCFVDISAEYAVPRLGSGQSRPLLAGDPRRAWVELMAQRRAVYEAVSTMRVLADGVESAQVADEIDRRISAAPRYGLQPNGRP